MLALALASFGIGTTEFVITGLDSAGPARIDGRLGVDAGTDLRHGRPDGSAAKRVLCGTCGYQHGSFGGAVRRRKRYGTRQLAATWCHNGLRHRSKAACSIHFPFLFPNLGVALYVSSSLLTIAFIRYRFMGGKLANTIVQVILGSGIVFAIGVGLGRIGAG